MERWEKRREDNGGRKGGGGNMMYLSMFVLENFG